MRKTNYPERYTTPSEQNEPDGENYFYYAPREPVFIGRDAYALLPARDGTILAVESAHGAELHGAERGRHFHDQDCIFMGDPNFIHFIWIRDGWRLFELKWPPSNPIMDEDSVKASRMRVEVTS